METAPGRIDQEDKAEYASEAPPSTHATQASNAAREQRHRSARHRSLAAVIPAYRAASTIGHVIEKMPSCVDLIIVVNDASPDDLDSVVESIMKRDGRVRSIRHTANRGVGGAMRSGYEMALAMKMDYIVKVDADGQMDPKHLPAFVAFAQKYECDYVKANRFGSIQGFALMPKTRLFGNIALSFMNKLASGYWNIFDPQNGFVMIDASMLRRLNLTALDRGYFFENSMLIQLNMARARIGELNIPAIYDNELSSLKLHKVLIEFPARLFFGFLQRMLVKYIIRSLSPVALLLMVAIAFIIFGSLWSAIAWHQSIVSGIPATTGTVIIGLMPILMGWSALLQALVIDMQDAGESLNFNPEHFEKGFSG